MKKRVGIIYTGGTIGMMPTESGYAPNPSAFPEMLDKIHDVNLPGFPEYEVICLSKLLDSSDISYREWSELGEMIAKRYDDFDGFVVLHGTDTMAYTASVMSFILEGLDKAVVFTGSQIPLCRMRSDGIDNLVTSILVAASGRVHEVCLYFGGQLMRGNRVTKVSANGLLAFESPNYPRLADVGTEIAYRSKFLRKSEGGSLTLATLEPISIAVLKIFPGIRPQLFESVIDSGVRAIVIEAFGAGNIPSDGALAAVLKRAADAGVLIVVTSQCGSGTVSLGTYATSSPLLSAGAVSGQDMTTEAAVAKLYYLFSKYGDVARVREQMGIDLVGEMSGEL